MKTYRDARRGHRVRERARTARSASTSSPTTRRPRRSSSTRTISGGVTINNCMLHVAQHDLPFGGIGASGMGHYHGYEGFLEFSKLRPVFTNPRLSLLHLFYPPYTAAPPAHARPADQVGSLTPPRASSPAWKTRGRPAARSMRSGRSNQGPAEARRKDPHAPGSGRRPSVVLDPARARLLALLRVAAGPVPSAHARSGAGVRPRALDRVAAAAPHRRFGRDRGAVPPSRAPDEPGDRPALRRDDGLLRPPSGLRAGTRGHAGHLGGLRRSSRSRSSPTTGMG